MTRKEVLEEAGKCILQDRDSQYGPPENSFSDIAKLWTAYLDYKIEPHQVAVMMNLLKVARIKHNPNKLDSWVDGVGYLACGAEIVSAPLS